MYPAMIVLAVNISLALAVMVDWTTLRTTGFIVPLNLQYVVIILFHRRFLHRLGIPLTNTQSLVFGIGVALHPLGMVYDLYATIPFWDHITHFTSAALLSAAVLVILWGRDTAPRRSALYSFLLIVLTGAAWEYFELFISTTLLVHGTQDTMMDMAFNILGWLTILLFGKEPLSNMTRMLQHNTVHEQWKP